MNLFIFKLIVTPVLIGAVSLAGRRCGPAVGGLLLGLPLTSGPLVFFLVVALLIQHTGLLVTYLAASAVALSLQAALLWLLGRQRAAV